MKFTPERTIAPCCSVSRHQLARIIARRQAEDERLQRRFERICARELLGEFD